MKCKTKLVYPVGYAKQIAFPWEDNMLSNAYGVVALGGNACSQLDVVPFDEFGDDVELQGVFDCSFGVLQWTVDGFLIAKTNDFYDAISDDAYTYVKVVETPQGVLILTDKGVLTFAANDERAKTTQLSHFVDATMCHGRTFATTGVDTRLYFSDLLDYTGFDGEGAGWIDLPPQGGKCIALAVVDGKLCVFRRHAVDVVTVAADQRDFSVRTLAFCCGKLYGNTVASNGSEAMFLTDWGLWSFDGKAFFRRASHLDSAFCQGNDYAIATWCHQGYVLHCKMHFDSRGAVDEQGFVNNALVVASKTGTVVLRGWDFTHLAVTAQGSLVATSNGLVYTLCRQAQPNTPRQCQIKTDFNSHKGKTVQFVTFTTSVPLTLLVYFNNTCRRFSVKASDCPQSVFVNATGKSFRFVFDFLGEGTLSPVSVDYLLYKGGVAP